MVVCSIAHVAQPIGFMYAHSNGQTTSTMLRIMHTYLKVASLKQQNAVRLGLQQSQCHRILALRCLELHLTYGG